MMVAEAFLYSHGILGIGGVVAFALGASMLIDVESPEFRISQSLIAGFAVGSVLFVLLIVRTALGARQRKIVSGAEEMIGARAIVQDWGDDKGHVFVHGERWSASGDGELDKDQVVRVVARSGLTVEVERERRAKIINAEGEQQAAQKLLEAAVILGQRPEAMQLRYLSTPTPPYS